MSNTDCFGNLNADDPRKFRVSVVGHSYIRHLKNFSRDFPSNTNFSSIAPVSNNRPNWLDLDNCVVSWHSLPGSNVSRLATDQFIYDELHNFRPNMIFLQIGSNDLDDQYSEPFKVAYQITELADNMIHSLALSKVFIGKLIKRNKTRSVSVTSYNDAVFRTNGYLQNFCDPYYSPDSSSFWIHRGLTNSCENVYFHDKVHMNDLGNLKLYRSIRAAVKTVMPLLHHI